MQSFILLFFFCIFNEVFGAKSDKLNVEDFVDSINNIKDVPWRASTYGFKEIDVDNLAQTKLGLKHNFSESSLNDQTYYGSSTPAYYDRNYTDNLPENYDLRKKYKNCQIDHIRDQSNCGSCWAFAATSALSDRFCIHSNETVNVQLSSEYVVSCNTRNGGCAGGCMTLVWIFFRDNGVITGGDYESDIGCQPYSIKPCGYSKQMPCVYPMAYTPRCKNTRCTNEWYKYKKEPKLYKTRNWYEVSTSSRNEYLIRKEIYENGPISAGFLVYTDFIFYKKGIYIRTEGWPIGGHAVRVVGWGVENGTKYWLAANSWGDDWGENGFFRIRRGRNDVYFESMMHAGIPDLE